LRARLALVGDAKEGRRGGFLRGLDVCSSSELVLLRFAGGSFMMFAYVRLVGAVVSARILSVLVVGIYLDIRVYVLVGYATITVNATRRVLLPCRRSLQLLPTFGKAAQNDVEQSIGTFNQLANCQSTKVANLGMS
jgi:hypothetical protein